MGEPPGFPDPPLPPQHDAAREAEDLLSTDLEPPSASLEVQAAEDVISTEEE